MACNLMGGTRLWKFQSGRKCDLAKTQNAVGGHCPRASLGLSSSGHVRATETAQSPLHQVDSRLAQAWGRLWPVDLFVGVGEVCPSSTPAQAQSLWEGGAGMDP